MQSYGKNTGTSVEYAMANGWDLDQNRWSFAQNKRYNEWAKFATSVDNDYSNMTEFAGTTLEATPPTEITTFRPGENSVVTTNDPAGSVWGRRRRSNTLDFGPGQDDVPADELLARMREPKTVTTNDFAAIEAPEGRVSGSKGYVGGVQSFEDMLTELESPFEAPPTTLPRLAPTKDILAGADIEMLPLDKPFEAPPTIPEQPDVFYDEPLGGGRPTRVVPPMDVEMQPMGETVVDSYLMNLPVDPPAVGPVEPYTVKPYTAGEIKPFNIAEQWQMPKPRAMQIVGDLEAPLLGTAEITIPELEAIIPPEILKPALAESFVGMDGFGMPSFKLSSLEMGVAGIYGQILLAKLAQTGRAGKDVADIVNITTGLATVASAAIYGMGPVGWALAAGSALYALGAAYAKQQKNILDNDWGGDTADTRMMMVLDNGTWYPAILKNRVKPEGFGDTSNTISVSYGKPGDLRFAFEEGKYRGHFVNQKQKEFRMFDDEWSGDKSTFAWSEKKDFMRPWYFLSKAESDNVMKGYGTKDFGWKTIKQDTSEFSPYMKDMAEIQSALDFMQNKERKTADPTSFLVSATKALRKTNNEMYETGRRFFTDPDFQDNLSFPRGDEEYGFNTKWDSYISPIKPGLPSVHKLNSDYIPRQMSVLDTTRRVAASTVGVDFRVYNDFAKDLPIANSLSELKDQYTAIHGYVDRNEYQKQYLEEKASVRYLMGVSNHFGYGADLYDVMYAGSQPSGNVDYRKAAIAWTPDDPERTYTGDLDILPPRYSDDVAGEKVSLLMSTPAWVNEGETPLGIMEGLAGWQKEAEATFEKSNFMFRSAINSKNGYNPEDLIEENGNRMKAIDVAKAVQRQIKDEEEAEEARGDADEARADAEEARAVAALKGIVYKAKEGTGQLVVVKDKHGKVHFVKAEKTGQVKGYKAEWEARQKTLAKEWEVDDKKAQAILDEEWKGYQEDFSSQKLATHYADTGKKITYANFLKRVQEPAFDPDNVGVSSTADMLLGLLQRSAHWVPRNLALNEHNLPAKMIAGTENHYKPFLEMLDDMPDIKANAEHLHDLVYTPATEKYMERYHPTTGMSNKQIAKDYSGVELFDDWSLPFKHMQNSVLVNHQIHTRMDFGFDEI